MFPSSVLPGYSLFPASPTQPVKEEPTLDMKGVVEEDLGDDKLIARGIAESTLHPDNPYHPNNYRAAANYPMVYKREPKVSRLYVESQRGRCHVKAVSTADALHVIRRPHF